jgi:hypothetical protein
MLEHQIKGMVMPTFNIANVNALGTDVVIVIVDNFFEKRPSQEQAEILGEFQKRALAAGFKGEVVPIWDGGGGSIRFMVPKKLVPFFSEINQRWIADNFNKKLSW